LDALPLLAVRPYFWRLCSCRTYPYIQIRESKLSRQRHVFPTLHTQEKIIIPTIIIGIYFIRSYILLLHAIREVKSEFSIIDFNVSSAHMFMYQFFCFFLAF
jgi:hypothetical protein